MNTFSTVSFLLRSIKESKLILIGLIIFFACSLPITKGGKPKIDNVEPILKRLSSDEIKELVTTLPTDALTPPMVKYSGIDKDMSREEIINLLRLSEIKGIPLLELYFPNANFLKGIDWGIQSEITPVYLTAIIDNKSIYMPTGFNRLLVENGLDINDKNIIELAKAFVILALGSETVNRIDDTWNEELVLFPQITFLEGKKIKEYDDYWATTMDVEIRVRIGDSDIQTWKFSQARNTPRKGEWVKIGQFGVARVFINNKPVRSYQIKRALKETEK